MAATPEALTALECPECNVAVVPKGKQTPAMALGSHRWIQHKVKGSHARRTKNAVADNSPKTPPAQAEAEATPLAVVRDIAEGVKGKGAPTAHQLTGAIGKIYGYGMMFRVSRLVERDPRLTDDQRVEYIERLAPSEQTCESVASPFARVIARSSLNKTAGRAVVENIDILDCVVALLESERALAAYSREVRQVLAGAATGEVATLHVAAPQAQAPGAPMVPPGTTEEGNAYAGGPRSPEPVQGIVVSAADVAAQLGNDLPPLPPDVNTGAVHSMEVGQ